METKKDVKLEVMGVHNLFWESYANRDIDLRFSLCSEDVTFIGSGLHERAKNKAEYKKINQEGVKQFPDPFQIEFLWTNLVILNEKVACVESEVVWSQLINNELSKELLRNTTLLKCENNKWLVSHIHGSVPDYRLKVGEYMTNEQTIIRNRELERQVFERTKDLNKTLEELEQKNSELEIETALEKVRSSALAMKETADMVDVCQVISDQLQLLGVKDIRNVQTAIINEHKGTYLNYQYFIAYDKGIVEETEYNKHPKVLEMVQEMKRSENSTFSGSFEGEELNRFREYRKQDNQFPDPLLDEATSMHYYFYSIGSGGLGLSTYKPLIDDELEIFKRFHNVFTLAYRRFIDIETAITQAREAQIEAALERVRSRSMGMQKSEELKNVIRVVYEQFVNLKINVDHAGFVVDYTPKGDWHFWIADEQDIPSKITHPYFESVWAHQFNEAKEKGLDFFATNLNFEEKNKFYNELLSYVPGLPEASKDFYLTCAGLAATTALFDNVSLYIENFSGIPYADEENKILMRFGKVFQQTYTRFLDLQKAEEQAREAKIEAALEKVRSKTMSMQSSDELADTATVLFHEIKKISKEELIQLTIGIYHEAAGLIEFRVTSWAGGGEQENRAFNLSIEEPTLLKPVFMAWKQRKKSIVIDLSGEQLEGWLKYRNANTGVTVRSEDTKGRRVITAAFFSKGHISLSSPLPLSAETIQLLERFAAVFNLTYTRFNDLKQAEAQNKIIQAENDRKTKELEDARQLQLSMLPKELPKLPHLDIAVYMKTATEVGGDYYDFYVQPDGTLTILVGDATGHGMMSGMMVSIMKSFFISNRMNIELKHFFENSNSSIKDMHLGRLMMPLMGVQITYEKVIATNAGMPSLLYFRNKSQKAGEFVSNNMPLGAMKGTKYLLKEIKYEKGDTLLLMTDGFAELKNENNEQYGYQRVKEEFKSVAQKSSDKIVDYLKNSASKWINGVEPDDDVTFVVIKVK